MPAEALASAAGTSTMEITVSKIELLRELTATQGVVERKTTIPILSNYLLEAAAAGQTPRWWAWRARISPVCRRFRPPAW
jgi:hypothetical protein